MSGSWTETLLVGLAEMLDAAGVGRWDPTGELAQDATLPAIKLIELPDQPEAVICLTDYPVSDDPIGTEGELGVQVRTRGGRSPLAARAYADGVFSVLHGRSALTFADTDWPVVVAQIYRESATPIGPDSQGRHERSENYTVHVNRPSAGRDTE